MVISYFISKFIVYAVIAFFCVLGAVIAGFRIKPYKYPLVCALFAAGLFWVTTRTGKMIYTPGNFYAGASLVSPVPFANFFSPLAMGVSFVPLILISAAFPLALGFLMPVLTDKNRAALIAAEAGICSVEAALFVMYKIGITGGGAFADTALILLDAGFLFLGWLAGVGFMKKIRQRKEATK